MTILLIYKDGTEIDITNEVVSNTLSQSRSDDAFSMGQFKLKTSQIGGAIPPYTFLTIENEGITEQYLASSRVSHYLTYENLYVHEVELLEPTAYLSCFIIGAKAFSTTGSNKQDSEKLEIIKRLMAFQYTLTLTFDSTNITHSEKYSFPENTNLFTALNEIALRHNCRVKATFTNYLRNQITISFIDVSGGSVYTLSEDRILTKTFYQSSDDYCDTLECVAQNVIDRDVINRVEGLVPKGDGVVVGDDAIYLELPVRAEKVTRLEANIKVNLTLELKLNYSLSDTLGNPQGDIGTFDYWVSLAPQLEEIYTRFLYPLDRTEIGSLDFFVEEVDLNDEQYVAFSLYDDLDLYADIPLVVLPKEQYDILSAIDKPKYAYFQPYSNRIEGISEYANTDLWTSIFTGIQGPVVRYADFNALNLNEDIVNDAIFKHAYVHYSYSPSENFSVDRLYNAEYIACADMKLQSYKSIEPTNESNWKEIRRTYGNSANFIDYNKLTKSMQTTVDMLGIEECSIEYNTTGITPPYATQKIFVDGIPYYVASVEYENSLRRTTATINLTRNYNKVCEAIGIPTGYNQTRLPNDDIIDRMVYVEFTADTTFLKKNLYVQFYFRKGNWTKTLYKRATPFTDDNGITIVIEATDHYCFDKSVSRGTGGFIMTEHPYGDDNNEFEEVALGLCYPPHDLTLTEARNLPLVSEDWETLTDESVVVHKDARERLIFTIRINNANINLVSEE